MRHQRVREYFKTIKEMKGRKKPLDRDRLHHAPGAAKEEAGLDARHLTVNAGSKAGSAGLRHQEAAWTGSFCGWRSKEEVATGCVSTL